MKNLKDIKIAVIGLGYVGLPLALEFAKKFSVVGYDIDSKRIDELAAGFDATNEAEKNVLLESSLNFSTELEAIKDSNVYIVTVPTPIDDNNLPVQLDIRTVKLGTPTQKVLPFSQINLYPDHSNLQRIVLLQTSRPPPSSQSHHIFLN